VDEVIRSIDDKCPGPYGIDGVVIKRLHKSLPTFWISLFNKCFLLGCFPKDWKKARVIAIPKSDKTKLRSMYKETVVSLWKMPRKS